MLLLLSLLLSKSFEAECTPYVDGAKGTCKTCNADTKLCTECNYPDQYIPDEIGGCSLKPQTKCTETPNGAAGTCSKCDAQTNLCTECNYKDQFEPNQDGSCSQKPPKRCTEVNQGGARTCAVCDATTDLCTQCNYADQYEPNQDGGCSEKPKRCKAIPNGEAGTCSVCDATTDLCTQCNYADQYEPNQDGGCSQKPPKRCTEVNQGGAGTCAVCDATTDLCTQCNYADKYEPNQNGSCSEKPKRCTEVPNGEAGTCSVCDTVNDLCKTCNYADQYEPNASGSCSKKQTKNCVEVANGEGGTCATCNTATDMCQSCNHPEQYELNQAGVCTPKKVNCQEIQYGAAGTCSICDPNTNLCATCNYATKYEPDQFGTCKQKPFVRCVNVTDGAAGTCAKCDVNTNICLQCNYPDIYEPDQHGSCTIKSQSQCIENTNGDEGTCAVCNPYTHMCHICNFPYKYSPDPFGGCIPINKNECASTVSNCFKCDKKDNTKCIECQYGYGLRGGFCTKCAAHLYDDSRHPCNPDCSIIPNCHVDYEYDDDDCVSENGHLYCLTCNYGFHPSDDFRTCVQNKPGPCSTQKVGCLECAYEGSHKCVKCDTDKNFILDREDGKCECKRGFEYVNGECQKVKEVECDDSLKKCDKCAINSHTCIECDDDYGLENNKCVKCPDGAYVSGYLPCLKRCTKIENCAYCSDDGKYCYECDKSYEETDDHSKCVHEGKGDCNNNVVGCSKCSKSDPSYCLKCDKHNHFEESEVFPGTCVCDEDYDFYNGQCITPLSPAVPPPGPSQQIQIVGVEFTKYVIVQGTIYTISSSAEYIQGALYILVVPITITKIIIPRGPTNFQLTIPQIATGEGVTVNADPTTQVDLSCPNGAKIVIPDNNNNYNLKGSGLITIDPPSGATTVIVRKITMSESGSSLQLNSSKASISVKEIDVYGYQNIAGQTIAYHTNVEITKIQSGATFVPENITLTTLKIGIQSVLQINGNRNVDISNYHVYYNASSTKIPIQFRSPFPNFKKVKLQIFNMNQGALIEEEETFNVASFSGENSQQACQDFTLDSKKSDFKGSQCQTFGDTTYMVAKKSEDEGKKKLSGGAIAGIVIACVVVVGLVVFLCVWFLVIKKNRPAHKRSGEPANSREKLEI